MFTNQLNFKKNCMDRIILIYFHTWPLWGGQGKEFVLKNRWGWGYLHRLFYLDLNSYYFEVQVTWIWSVWTGNCFLNHKSILPESNLPSNIAKLGVAGKNQGSFLAPVEKYIVGLIVRTCLDRWGSDVGSGCGAWGKMFKWRPPSA